jgi:hypothetical protein
MKEKLKANITHVKNKKQESVMHVADIKTLS